MIKIFIKLIFICPFIFGNQIKVSAPKIILQNISFNLTFSGSFPKDNQYTLKVNNANFFPEKQTGGEISFDKIKVLENGKATFVLYQESNKVFEMKKNIIPGWISVLPPFIAIGFSFATRSVVPSLFIAIWFGVSYN
tara:strand:- start:91 stop:501 length:411 start_codon:yes stop_codon:yes gene_type:complete